MNTNISIPDLMKLLADNCESVLDFSQELSDYVKANAEELPYVGTLIDQLDTARRQRNELSDDLERTREELRRTREELDELKARVAGLEK